MAADPEKQPLLPVRPAVRRRFRPLTTEEVIDYQHDVSWYRARFFLVIMFWSLIAMCLSIITGFLMNASECMSIDIGFERMPAVAPVHLNLASLAYTARNQDATV